ncbi:MAG: DUF484 family protein [Pseudomonadales bacterium]|nr:DUF484 family protein [Halieaceae bacterium]MCP5189472.1 DUF484 family protein [Pseudomonadales bacterium]MCP5205252.1 DUF484 family protein [Pseudomonadales bacterium]
MSASKEQAAAPGNNALSDEAVREFLMDNGDFLQRNPELLDHLHISHASGSAVSLVEKQVSVLRERNVEMRHRLKALTANARENDTLFANTRSLVVKLLEANSVAELYDAFMASMKNDFQAEYACMILFGDDATGGGYRVASLDSARAAIGALFNGRKPVCGALRKEEFNYLFGSSGNPQPISQGGSAAVMPLTDGAQLGLIAVGSADAGRYHSAMGTLFLAHIGEVILRLLPRLQQDQA